MWASKLSLSILICLLLSSLGLSSSPPSLARRQIPDPTPLKPVKIEKLEPQLNPLAKRERLLFGPFKLYGSDDRHNAFSTIGTKIGHEGMTFDRHLTGFCKDCTVLAAKADVNFLNMTRATISHGVYNHHLLILDPSKKTLPWYLCPGQGGELGQIKAAGFMITGVAEAMNWYSPPNSTVKAGFAIGKQQRMVLNANLINYRKDTVDVYVSAEMEYLEAPKEDYLDASMTLLSVTGCGSPDFMVPKGQARFNLTGPRSEIPRDGYIVSTTGHLHDGGVNIALEVNGKTVCNSRAIYGGLGNSAVAPDGRIWETIRAMTECNEPIPVKAGDIVSTTAIYDTSAHALRTSATGHGEGDSMGIMFLNFAAKR